MAPSVGQSRDRSRQEKAMEFFPRKASGVSTVAVSQGQLENVRWDSL